MGLNMTSQQQEGRIVTTCSDCYFYKDGDCEDNRIEKFRNAGRLDYEDNPVISGRCFLKRTKEWGESTEEPLTKARKQIEPTFGLSFIDTEELHDFNAIVESILNIDYDPKKLIIHIVTNKNNALNKISKLDKIKEKFPSSAVTFSFETDKRMLETEAFLPLREQDYLANLNGNHLNSDVFNKIDNFINEKMQQFAYYEFGEGDPKSSVIFTRVVKGTYLDFCDYKLMEEYLKKETKSKSLFCNLNEE